MFTKISIIKFVDRLFGSLFCYLIPQQPLKQNYSIQKVLLIRPGGIGDAVLLIPVLVALKNRYPECSIDVVVEKRNSAVFTFVAEIRTCYEYDTIQGIFSVLRSSYDVVIDTEQWYRLSAVVARLVQAPVKIGFNSNERRRMFTHCVPYGSKIYESDNFINLLRSLNIANSSLNTETFTLTVPIHTQATAGQLLQSVKPGYFVVLFPGASISEKRWEVEKFYRVAVMLSVIGLKIVVVGGVTDRVLGNEICTGGVGYNLAGKTTLAETAAVIQKSSLLISGDTGVLHIAVGLDIPTVSLFGPSMTKKWAPRGERHIVINKELPCSPCTTFGNTPPCPIKAKCMSDISVEDVFSAAVTLLTRTGALPAPHKPD